jgi:hypothetical protein
VPLAELDEFVKVIEIPDASPLAFDVARPTESVPLRMSVAGLDIVLAPEPEPRKIVANFLRYPDIVATADGKPAAVTEDRWQRIVVDAPADAKQIRIRYSPPRATGIVMGLLLAAAGVVAMYACGRGRT